MPDVVSPWTIAHQVPLSMGFLRQAYGSVLPFPSPGDLPDPGIEPGFLHYQEILYCLSHFDGSLPSTLGHLYLELGQMAIESAKKSKVFLYTSSYTVFVNTQASGKTEL